MYCKNVYKNDDMKRREHMAVRNTFGWYYFTHYLLEVTGKDAAAFLDKMFANPIANLKVGRERYTTMLSEDGNIMDDVVVIRLEEEKFWISTLFIAQMIKWFEKYKAEFEVSFTDVTSLYDMYAVQGPKAKEVIQALADVSVDDLGFFAIMDNSIDKTPVKINRAGFSGEKIGYEIYIAPEKGEYLEGRLSDLAKELGGEEVTEFQVMAMTLPTEAGFYYMRDLLFRNPFEVGLEKGIKWDRDFIGKEALERIREEGAKNEIVGFTVEEEDIFINHGGFGNNCDRVYLNGEEVGIVAKLTYGYVKDTNIGYIYSKKGALKIGDHVKIKEYDAVITDKNFL